MEELKAWIKIGKDIGANKLKFNFLKNEVIFNLEKIQSGIYTIQSSVINSREPSEELLTDYANRIKELENKFVKLRHYITLKSIKIIFNKFQKTIFTLKSVFRVKKYIKSCYQIKNLLQDHLSKPYADIIRLAILEIELFLRILSSRSTGNYQ
jgi:hypothetical protein